MTQLLINNAALKNLTSEKPLQPLNVAVSGPKDLNEHEARIIDTLAALLKRYVPTPNLILGSQPQFDDLVMLACAKAEIDPLVTYEKPQWENARGDFQPMAGYLRNELVLRRADHLIIITHIDDIGTQHLLENARKLKKSRTSFDLDVWSMERAHDYMERAFAHSGDVSVPNGVLTYAQCQPVYHYGGLPETVALNLTNYVYCGRKKGQWERSVLANPIHRGGGTAGSTLPAFKKYLYHEVVLNAKPNRHIRRALERIDNRTVLLCWCKQPETCHTSAIVDFINWQRQTPEGRATRMTAAECRDYDRVHLPSHVLKLSESKRAALIKRYFRDDLKINPEKAIRINTAEKHEPARPIAVGDSFIYVNGKTEIPVKVQHIEYGKRWTDDPATGIRRLEITNCILVNPQLQSTYVYSDLMFYSSTDKDEQPYPTMLPIIAPYLVPRKEAADRQRLELSALDKLRKGQVIQVIQVVDQYDGDKLVVAKGTVLDVGVVKQVQSEWWYNTVPSAPVIKDVSKLSYRSLLTSQLVNWDVTDGTEIRPVS